MWSWRRWPWEPLQSVPEYSDIRLILPHAWQVASRRDPIDLARAIIRADRERAEVSRLQRQWIDANGTLAAAVDRLERCTTYANHS